MTGLLNQRPIAHRRAVGDGWPHGMLVASDGREPSDAALIAARNLAPLGEFGVLSVIPTNEPLEHRAEYAPAPSTFCEHTVAVRAQVARLCGDSANVPVEMRTGYPPAVIAAYADTHGVPLLVVGIGRPRVLDRLLGDESTLRVVRLSNTPVFAVASGRAVPPQRVVVGIDFTSTSMRAARLALDLAAPDAEVVLAHVESPAARSMPESGMRRVIDTMQTGFCGHVHGRLLRGDVATELLSFANDWGADAIAIGMHGDGPDDRIGIGNVAMRTVRCASCSVIVAPRTAS